MIAILALLAVTNPGKPAYVEWAKEQIIEETDNNMLAKGLVAVAGDTLISNSTSYKNYILLSIYDINILDQETKVLGILGNFIVLNENKASSAKLEPTATIAPDAGNSNTVSEIVPIDEDKDGYWRYHNKRYGFHINYPHTYLRSNPPANGDGQQFVSPNRAVNVTVYGTNVFDGTTLRDQYNELLRQNNDRIGFNKILDNWFVVSWTNDGIIYYQKTFAGVGSKNTMIIRYTQNSKDEGNYVVEKMEASFVPGNLAVAH